MTSAVVEQLDDRVGVTLDEHVGEADQGRVREIAATPEVWVCTSDDVAAHARQVRAAP